MYLSVAQLLARLDSPTSTPPTFILTYLNYFTPSTFPIRAFQNFLGYLASWVTVVEEVGVLERLVGE
jgi:hypothetical protein